MGRKRILFLLAQFDFCCEPTFHCRQILSLSSSVPSFPWGCVQKGQGVGGGKTREGGGEGGIEEGRENRGGGKGRAGGREGGGRGEKKRKGRRREGGEGEEDDGGEEGDKGTWAMDPGIHLNGLQPITSHSHVHGLQVQCLCRVGPIEHGSKQGACPRTHHRILPTQHPVSGVKGPLRNWPQIPGFLEPLNFRG